MPKILRGDPEDITTVCGETFFTPAPCRHCARLRYVPMWAETPEGRCMLYACRNITMCKEVNDESDTGT